MRAFSEMTNDELADFIINNEPNKETSAAQAVLIMRNKQLRHELELLGVKPDPNPRPVCPECGWPFAEVKHGFFDDDKQRTVGQLVMCQKCGELYNHWFEN